MKELNILIQEIIDFGDVIAYTDNPADSDFQNACYLFSCYLEDCLKEIQYKLRGIDSDQKITWASREITKLNNLTALPRNSTAPYIQWTRDLFQYCEGLQHSKQAIA